MISAPIIWGLLLGLGSSLHCAGMCGPLGCSLLLLGPKAETRSALALRLAALQLGRLFSYLLLGLAFGIFGAGLQAKLDFTPIHLALQWTAGMAVVWLGLSTAGYMPSLALADRVTAPLARGVATMRSALSGGGTEIALLSGMLWGITPCAMVYTALFNSLLTGNPGDGMLLMAAFGLGTLPAATLSILALYGARTRQRRPGRRLAGLFMVLSGVLALLLTVPGSPLCITG